MMEERILVTGTGGFVGSRLAHDLSRRPHLSVRAVSRTPRQQSTKSIEPVVLPEGFSNRTSWSSALASVDVVIHLAARVHVTAEACLDPLAEFRAINVAATLHLARHAAMAKVRRFIFLSSVKVNGESSALEHPLREDHAPGPQDPYAISKYEAEQGLRQIAAETEMEVVIIRPPLVYGPGVKANFAALMAAIAKGTPLPLGALHNRRSLVALDNLVDFIMTCLAHPQAANETFLVSDGEDLSTTNLARRLGQALHRPARLIPVPASWLMAGAGLVGRRATAERLCGNLQVDITKARTLLGWTPPISVDEGLRRAAAGLLPK